MSELVRKGFWVFEPSLLPTLLIFSGLAEYDFDSSDLDAIQFGLSNTFCDRVDEEDVWFTYKFIGKRVVEIELTRDPEDVIFVNVAFEKGLRAKVEMAIWIIESFDMVPRHWRRVD